MTYVLDASAVIDLLVRSEAGDQVRDLLAGTEASALLTVAHLDAEVFSGLARNHRAGLLEVDEVTRLVRQLSKLAMTRAPISVELLEAAWSLRDNVAARDALYVAAAQSLDASLITTDQRLARAVPDLVAALD